VVTVPWCQALANPLEVGKPTAAGLDAPLAGLLHLVELIVPTKPPPTWYQQFSRSELLRWLYLGRLTLVTGILAGSLLTSFLDQPEEDTLAIILMFLVALAVTAGSFWHTHAQQRDPGEGFLYAQVVLDTLLVTGIVHYTGGADSGFYTLYILVISAGALLLPLPGGVVVGALVSILYFGDLVWGYQEAFSPDVALRITLFTIVALVTGVIGDRLRRAGQALGVVASELRQLRLDTGDILANLSTGVLTVNGDGRLAYANSAAESLLGIELQGFLGHPILQIVEAVAPGLGDVLRDAIDNRRPVSRGTVEATSPKGAVRLGVSTAVLERGEDEMPSATALFQDITDLERLDELNVRAERLEAVATLSASLAHEIKNPLASIRSAVEQLSRSRLSAKDRGVLERLVLTESDRLSRLLSEFLDYAALRMSAREELDLQALVRGCLLLVGQHPDVTGVDVEARMDDRPITLVGDADLLHRALFNLVLNGAQSAGAGGRVVVTLEDQRDRPLPRGTPIEYPVRITVQDSGPGIDDEQRSRIFDPFFTTKVDGSGLGLAVVHRAVEAHQGAVFVEESPLGGAQFVIFLPGVAAGVPVEAEEAVR
jgi:two-component system sensor histidine kinase PilS (NtrC family)